MRFYILPKIWPIEICDKREVDNMNSEEKLFEFMTKMYSEMQEGFSKVNDRFESLENRFDGLENRFDGLENEVKSIKKTVLNIEQDHGNKLQVLFDGYKQTTDQLERIEKEVTRHDDIILRRVK